MICDRCDDPAARTLGIDAYCHAHLDEILEAIRARLLERDGLVQETTHGRGVQTGPARVEYGPDYVALTCDQCAATWTGVAGDICWWCERRYQLLLDDQAALVLTPPKIDPDDRDHDKTIGAWLDRMSIAVEAGTINSDEARQAWTRGVRHGHAA